MTKNKKGQKVQKRRISDSEQSLLKSIFEDNEPMLLAVRNLFFGFELDESEKALIQGAFRTEESRKLMRKIFLPELQKDIPIGQNLDLWMTVQIDNKTSEEKESLLESRALLINLIETALKQLEGSDTKVDLAIEKNDFVARNTFVMHVEQQLLTIRQLANEAELTAEEALENMKKDSTR